MERIKRKGEYKAKYQPELTPQRVHELYLQKQATGKFMTVILDRAVDDYTTKNQTWEEHLAEIEFLNSLDRDNDPTFEDLGDWKSLIDYDRARQDRQ